MARPLLVFFLSLCVLAACASRPQPEAGAAALAQAAAFFEGPHAADAAAVADVRAGLRSEADAAWWGFDAEDSTEALQGAIDSGARRVLVPDMGAPWVVRPIELRGDQEIVFERGVVVEAKRGEFRRRTDDLFHAADAGNLTLRGYGATLRMRKADYASPPYQPGEWRHAVSLGSVRAVRILGLRIEASGGDGIYISGSRSGTLEYSEDVVIRDVELVDHHRQGISVISARHLLIERCLVSDTHGTPPQSGIDFEPNQPYQRLENCVVRDCRFERNAGAGILIHLARLDRSSAPVSIRFEGCVVKGNTAAVMVSRTGRDARGEVVFAGGRIGWPRFMGSRNGLEVRVQR